MHISPAYRVSKDFRKRSLCFFSGLLKAAFVFVFVMALVACSGGCDDNSTVKTYSVGGAASGLTGAGLVLLNNSGDNLSVTANGSFTFSTKLNNKSAYAVTVGTHPSGQICTVNNASGSINGTNVNNVAVECHAKSYHVSVTVTGLSGSGLVLQNNGGDNLSIAANGFFTFATQVINAGAYNVTVGTQPSCQNQTCTVTNGSGTVNGSNVTNVGIACVIPHGSLDASFGTCGINSTVGSQASGIAIQTDGKIVTSALFTNDTQWDFGLVRYNSSGSVDSSFGTGGFVETSIGPYSDKVNDIAIQSDGKIVAAGYSYGSFYRDVALARYNTNGSLDTGFGTGGMVVTSIASNTVSEARSVAIQSDGRIVVAGYCTDSVNADIILERYNAGGNLDTTFGTGGIVRTSVDLQDYGFSVAIQSDGKIVVGGYIFNKGLFIARYNTDGSLDTTFGSGGMSIVSIGTDGGVGFSIAIQSDGKIIIAGVAFNGTNRNFALVRFKTNGSLDTTFGTGGVAVIGFWSGYYDNKPWSVAVQPDGKIVMAGSAYSEINKRDIALARCNTDGSIDTTFATGGIFIISIASGSSYDEAYDIAIQSDGKIVAAGAVSDGTNPHIAVLRFWP